MAKATGYQVRVSEKMLSLGYFRKEDMVWEVVSINDNGHGNGKCELCGHRPIRYEFTIRNWKDGQQLVVGSECVQNVEGINPSQAANAVRIFGEELAKAKKFAAAEKAQQAVEQYKVEYETELGLLEKAVANGIWLGGDTWDAYKVLTTGRGKLLPVHLEAIQKFVAENPVIKSKQDKLIDAVGSSEELNEMIQYVLGKVEADPRNDFWTSIWHGLDVNQYLSEKQIAAVKRNMEKELQQAASSQNNVLTEILNAEGIPF